MKNIYNKNVRDASSNHTYAGFLYCAVLLCLSGVIGGCGFPDRHYSSISGVAQGTTYHVIYENPGKKDYARDIDSVLDMINDEFSLYDTASVVSRVNGNDPDVVLTGIFISLFEKARDISDKTGGAFDITVGPLTNAWGFGRSARPEADSMKIAGLRHLIGYNKVRISGNHVVKVDPGIQLDFNGIAQGYSVDVVAAFMDKKEIKNYLVEIGGEVRAKGENERGEAWRIGIDTPLEGNNVPGESLSAVIVLNDKSVSTSGNYRRFQELNGIKYFHEIDPHAGYPVRGDLLSATVIADDCVSADAFATALMVIGLEKAKKLSEELKVDVLLIYRDNKGNFSIYCSPDVRSILKS
jgi:thiamine biosynthesis lipoprotein